MQGHDAEVVRRGDLDDVSHIHLGVVPAGIDNIQIMLCIRVHNQKAMRWQSGDLDDVRLVHLRVVPAGLENTYIRVQSDGNQVVVLKSDMSTSGQCLRV